MTLTITVRLRAASRPARPAPAAPGRARPGTGRAATGGSSAGRPSAGQPEAGSPPRAALPGVLHSLLPLAEPAGLLLAEAAGLGLIGKIVLATAFRSAQHALASQPG